MALIILIIYFLKNLLLFVNRDRIFVILKVEVVNFLGLVKVILIKLKAFNIILKDFITL